MYTRPTALTLEGGLVLIFGIKDGSVAQRFTSAPMRALKQGVGQEHGCVLNVVEMRVGKYIEDVMRAETARPALKSRHNETESRSVER